MRTVSVLCQILCTYFFLFTVSISAEKLCFLQTTEKQHKATATLMHMSNTDRDQKEGFGSVVHLSSFPALLV